MKLLIFLTMKLNLRQTLHRNKLVFVFFLNLVDCFFFIFIFSNISFIFSSQNSFFSNTTSFGDILYNSDLRFSKLLNSQVDHLFVLKSSKLIQYNQSSSTKDIK